MTITLVFNVSVHVEVDEVHRAVVSVKVDDEHAVGPVCAIEDDEGSTELLARGAAIAEEADWPIWEVGP
jgi:hypothetical protein